MTKSTLIILLWLFCACTYIDSPNKEIKLNNWQFSRDRNNWENVLIPHDWAINGPFDKKYDLQYVAIEQNGETEETEKTGRSGALPWIGKGYYKTTVNLESDYKYAMLVFDGAMSYPIVKVNGKEAGHWAYGYNAFRLNVSNLMHKGENIIEVSLDNKEESSRWYPGGGLYRPVTLFLNTNETNIDLWNSYCRTITADSTQATLDIATQLSGFNSTSETTLQYTICYNNKMVKSFTQKINDAGVAQSSVNIEKPLLWSPETPNLYVLTTRVISDGKLVDQTSQRIGIRTVAANKEHGFTLNGQSRKIKGVCLHHDLGPLGVAENKAALIRQIRILKEMGCDAIRTAHNMPSTMQMDICDSMGMMVMAESFDMWIYPKCKNGYALYFKEWCDSDITNLVLNHRNHPSIIMWSIGNEIPEQWSTEGRDIAKHIQDLCHKLDPTRPVTQGMDKAEDALKSGFAQVMDVPGFNYRVYKYDNSIKQLPQGFLLGCETASTVSSRGIYKFPVEVKFNAQYADGQCSSYDTEYCPWSNLPDDDWEMQDDRQWTIGEFVWTGFDYLGEPTPYDTYWPSRSSYFGICDLAGLEKDRYYLYRSKWRTDSPTLHLLPHWTWNGREGEVTPVYCYTSYPSAELFVNGKSQGLKKKDKTSHLDRYRLRWNDVVYEPGNITVVAYDVNNMPADTLTIRTAGEPYALRLTADRSTLHANSNDLCFVTVEMVDANGTLCPFASQTINCSVIGDGSLRATCNGDATSLVSFNSPSMPLFSGKMVAIVEAKGKGNATLKVQTDNNITSSITIKVQ